MTLARAGADELPGGDADVEEGGTPALPVPGRVEPGQQRHHRGEEAAQAVER